MSVNWTVGVDDVLALAHHRELIQAVIGDLGHPDVGIGRREGVRRREGATAGQRVVEGALARIGQSDESEAFHTRRRLSTGGQLPLSSVTDVTAAPSAPSTVGGDKVAAERAFSKSILVSAVRCTLTYVLIPFVFPIIGFGTGVGPWIGVPIGVAAIIANAVSIRRFHRADHKWKWPMSAINVGIIGLLVVLVAVDLTNL